MATKVHMEALSPTVAEGQIVRCLEGEGDTVAVGTLLGVVAACNRVLYREIGS